MFDNIETYCELTDEKQIIKQPRVHVRIMGRLNLSTLGNT